MTTPMSPSMMIQSSCRISWLALRAPTTAGMSKLRATMAVCEVLPPTSVTKPVKTLCLNCSMSAGDKSCATNTSGTSMVSPSCNSCCGRTCGLVRTTGDVPPFKKCKTRSVTCSRSDLRSRKYASSISSNWRPITSIWLLTAHSALYNLFSIHCLTPKDKLSSSSSIKCTSSRAPNSGGASSVKSFCKRLSSSTTASRAWRKRAISASTCSG